MLKPGVFRHISCRNSGYPGSKAKRYPVPDKMILWTSSYPEYNPPDYTAHHITNYPPWADPLIRGDGHDAKFQPLWNSLDGKVNRVSYNGEYRISEGRPLNPFGRTGMKGRGLWSYWGPNHAADPVVTRWKRTPSGHLVLHPETARPVLQMVALRRENDIWYIPGGMVDPGEKLSKIMKRKFAEEAIRSPENLQIVQNFFANGMEIYKGYVDDVRNTDNAWMETVAYNFHDDDGNQVGKFQMLDAENSPYFRWIDLDSKVRMYANHIDIVFEVVLEWSAHW